jgi:2-polyprenyl-3-methyl-5-hydroxy-6-metoxy-1,4-benzoquinol methylase
MSEKNKALERFKSEKTFHDKWAEHEQNSHMDIISKNEVCTSPEIRKITSLLGDIKDKNILDVGCGLGEASVYFALKGANVTSTDISQGMLNFTEKLAKQYNVKLNLLLFEAENFNLIENNLYDIIYLGNLFHHVDIKQTVEQIKPYLKKDGILVSWDPVAYNPIINIYRKIAADVRTPDEHPLRRSDLKIFQDNFKTVKTYHFWFTTLIIFIIMATIQRRNPNEERYWKKAVEEGDRWRWLYLPLEKLDTFLFKIFPPLKWLCWNIVVFAKNKKKEV